MLTQSWGQVPCPALHSSTSVGKGASAREWHPHRSPSTQTCSWAAPDARRGPWRTLPLWEDGRQPHLSGRCHPAILQGSDSGLAGRRSLRSGTVAGISLSKGRARHKWREVPRVPRGAAREGGPYSKEAVRSDGSSRCSAQVCGGPGDSCAPLTCSAGPGEPAGPLPARAAGVAGPGGSRPRAAAVGSPVDSPARWVGTASQWQHRWSPRFPTPPFLPGHWAHGC